MKVSIWSKINILKQDERQVQEEFRVIGNYEDNTLTFKTKGTYTYHIEISSTLIKVQRDADYQTELEFKKDDSHYNIYINGQTLTFPLELVSMDIFDQMFKIIYRTEEDVLDNAYHEYCLQWASIN